MFGRKPPSSNRLHFATTRDSSLRVSPKKPSPTVAVMLRMPRDERDRIRAAAKREGMTLNTFVRVSVRAALARGTRP